MTTFTVRSNAELTDILSRIDGLGGGSIKLEADGGPYQISARDLGSAGGPVTITAADPSAPPVVDRVDLRDSAFITIDGLHIQGKEAGNPHAIYVSGSNDITLTNNTMKGVAEGFVSETNGAIESNSAMLLRDSQNITVSDNTISHFGTALGILELDGLIVSNNDISQLQHDGIQGAGIRNAEITDNHFHDFFGSSQTINHDDMIQIWGTNANSVTANLTISGNFLDAGDSGISQGIFIRNEEFGKDGTPTSGYFQNITITDNVLHNGAFHGISVSDTNGVTITSNTILKNEVSGLFNADGSTITATEPWYNVSNAQNVAVTGNLGSRYIGQADSAGNTVLVYDNTSDPMYVGNHIVNLSGQGDIGLGDMQIRTDSPLWGTTGAPMSSLSGADASNLGPMITATKVTENALARDLDAGASTLPEGASAAWHFADGNVTQGTAITHVFDTPGLHEVTLVITNADGTSLSTTRSIEIDDPYLFAFDFANGAEDITTRGIEAQVTGTAAQAFVNTVEDKGFYLNGNTGLSLGRENTQLFGRDAFNIDLRFKQTDAMKDGGLLGIHTVFKLDIEPDGALSFWLRTSDGEFKITTDAGVMDTTDWQDIGVRYDGDAGTLALVVDGTVMASGAASGATTGPLSWGLQLGSPWGDDATGVFESVSMSLPHDANPASGTPETPVVTPVVPEVPDTPVEPEPPQEPEEPQAVTPATPAPAPAPAPETPDTPTANLLLDIDFSDGGKDASAYAAEMIDETGGAGFTTGKDGAGFQLGGHARFSIDNANSQLFGLAAFNIGFDLRKDSADAQGGILNQHTILDLSARADGGLTLSLNTDEGSVYLTTDAGVLADTNWHKVNVAYDSDKGQVEILIDGTSIASAALTGRTAEAKYWDFVVGDPWQDSLPAVIDNLQITLSEDETPAAPQTPTEQQSAQNPEPVTEPEPAPAPEPESPPMHSLVDVDFSNGGRDASAYGSTLNDVTNGAHFTAGKEGDGFHITADTNFYIDNSATQIFGLEAFDIGFDIRKDEDDSFGGLLNQQQVLDLTVRANGALRLKLKTDEGSIKLRTEKDVLQDTDWHRINVTYDSDKGLAQILVDGEVMASGALTGRTAEAGRRDFVVGDPWHESVAATIDNLQITRPATAEEIAAATPSSASVSNSALAPLFDALSEDNGAVNAPASSLAQAWDQGQIDALSDGGVIPDPLIQI